MNKWDAPDSIFAPVVAAVPPGTAWPGFEWTLYWAADGIPVSTFHTSYKKKNSFKMAREVRDRVVSAYSGDSAKPFRARARLQDVTQGESPTNSPTRTWWMVGMTHLKDGLCAPAVPADYDSAILQVNRFRITKEGLTGAPQLALLRHRWAEAAKAASPDAIVFGGQHHWDDSWWTESLPSPTEV